MCIRIYDAVLKNASIKNAYGVLLCSKHLDHNVIFMQEHFVIHLVIRNMNNELNFNIAIMQHKAG